MFQISEAKSEDDLYWYISNKMTSNCIHRDNLCDANFDFGRECPDEYVGEISTILNHFRDKNVFSRAIKSTECLSFRKMGYSTSDILRSFVSNEYGYG